MLIDLYWRFRFVKTRNGEAEVNERGRYYPASYYHPVFRVSTENIINVMLKSVSYPALLINISPVHQVQLQGNQCMIVILPGSQIIQ